MGIFDRFLKPNFDKLKRKRDVKGLIKLLGNKDPWVREIAVKVLGDVGYDAEVASALAKMLKDKNPNVRWHAPYALAHLMFVGYQTDDSNRIVFSALIEALIHEDEAVRSSAAGLLREIDQDWEIFAGSEAGKGAISTLNKALKDKEVEVRRVAREILKKMKAQKN